MAYAPMHSLKSSNNGDFSNQAAGGNSNSASLKKDGAGGDFLEIILSLEQAIILIGRTNGHRKLGRRVQ